MKSSVFALVGCVLLLGFLIGREFPADAGATATASPVKARSAAKTPPARAAGKPAPKKEKGFSYDGDEYEVERDTAELDEIDRMSLQLRKTQPIWFLGVPMRQIPTDNWLMSELIHEIKPDYIIEAGTLFGGSALYYAALLEVVNPDGKVITVDINDEQIHEAARSHDLWKRRVKFIKGSSTAAEVIEEIREEVGNGKKVFITLDTLHAPDHVSKELALYAPFVSKGSYIILQDTFFEGLPEVLDDFLVSNPDFRRNSELDQRFMLTKYRGGFMKRE